VVITEKDVGRIAVLADGSRRVIEYVREDPPSAYRMTAVHLEGRLWGWSTEGEPFTGDPKEQIVAVRDAGDESS
jgi:hypothetical protein